MSSRMRFQFVVLWHLQMVALGAFVQRQTKEDDTTCLCKDDGEEQEEISTIRMLAPGGPKDSLLDFIADRFQRRVQSFYDKSGIQVEVLPQGNLPDLVDEMFVNAQTSVYEGYVFDPSIVGALTEAGGLADLSEFVGGSEELAWTDILPFNRNLQASYDNRVRSIPWYVNW